MKNNKNINEQKLELIKEIQKIETLIKYEMSQIYELNKKIELLKSQKN